MSAGLRTMLRVCVVASIAFSFASPSPARAGPGFVPSASAPRAANAAERTGHGWMVLPVQGADGALKREFALLHVPPRDEQGLVSPGTVRVASRFNAMPEALAAWENRVYVVFGRENRPEDATFGAPPDAAAPVPRVQRRVVSLIAAATVAGSHEFLPLGTVEARPALPGSGLLVDVVGTPEGPLALAGPDEFGAGGWSLRHLAGDAWVEVPWPTEAAAAQPRWARLVNVGTCVWLIVGDSDGGEASVWQGRAEHPAAEGAAANWAWSLLPGVRRGGSEPDVRTAALAHADGEVLAVDRGSPSGPARVWCVGLASAGLTVPRAIGPPSAADDASAAAGTGGIGVVALDGLGRVLLAWSESVSAMAATDPRTRTTALPAPPAAANATRVRVREVSLWTGGDVYVGTAKREGVLTPRDFQVLTFVVGGLMLAVMAFVLRSDANQTLSLPTGVSLARPAGRALAAGVDLAAAIVLASLVLGVSPVSVFGWHLLVGATLRGWMPLILAWGLVIVLCALQEWLTGRTLGKRLVGCEVLGLHKDPGPAIEGARFGSVLIGRPTLWQALLRNLLRWGVPPLGLLMVFDANWRHAGDLLAGTVVVNPAEEEA